MELIRQCMLTNSGYDSVFTQGMGLVSDGSCNLEKKTDPDIEVHAESTSDISNDEATQTVLNFIN